jgi:hypothetical protein
MSTHLDTLRAVLALADTRGPLHPVDPDLSREAGMDGNRRQYLQAARDLDAATAPATTLPTVRHTPEPWVAASEGSGAWWYVRGPDGNNVADLSDTVHAPSTDAANAARIVQCVNACAGIRNPGHALASIAGFLEDVARGCDPDEAREIAGRLLALLNGEE